MAGFRLAGFSGMVPRLARQLLAPNQAQVATNCILTSGDLRPRNGPLLVFIPVVSGDILSMFRMEKDGNEKWMAWNVNVDVARSPVAGNEDRRFYYTGDGEPKVSDYDTATAGVGPYPSGCYVLGVTPPVTAPTVVQTGGASTTNVTRVYVYTFLTQWNEESKPSPALAGVTGKVDATWTISGMDAAPPNSGTVTAAVKDTPSFGYATLTVDTTFGLRAGETVSFAAIAGLTDLNQTFTLFSVDPVAKKLVVILSTTQTYTSGGTWTRLAPHNTVGMQKRIYRTLTTPSGTEFHYIVTISAITTSYIDTATDTVAQAGEVMASGSWIMPDPAMRGIIIMANGIGVGFTGNEVHFSEPFRPFAWPQGYRQSYDQSVVAIGIDGTTIVGMTEGNPFTITGVEPVTMGGGMEKMGVAWPCMSKGSVASFAFGVGYASPQGLVMIGNASGADVVTKDLFTQKEWSELHPDTFTADAADNRYYCGYTVNDSTLMFVIDKAENASFIKINQRVTDIWADPATGKLYVASDGKIYEWEGDIGTKLSYEWKSKRFTLPAPLNYGAAKVDADFGMSEAETAAAQLVFSNAVAANQALINANTVNDGLADPYLGEYPIGGGEMEPLPPLVIDALQFQLWAEGQLRFSRQVLNSRAFRLPAGYKADNVEVVLSGNVKVTGVILAETMQGLKEY